MNTPSMEVIFLILSGVILMAGILYWFWSHIQLTQKKVQLLENAVFELRGMLANKGPDPPAPVAVISGGSSPPVTVYKDLNEDEEDDWVATSDSWAPATADQISHVSTPLDALYGDSGSGSGDLMPGGRIDAPLPVAEEEISLEQKLAERSQQESQFRDLFVPAASPPKTEVSAQQPQPQPQQSQPSTASLESMPVKELRRLAEERGIVGAAEMRKKDILASLRSQIPSAERTVDIAELVKVEEEAVAQPADNSDDIKEIPILE
jgi:hypothetical protein